MDCKSSGKMVIQQQRVFDNMDKILLHKILYYNLFHNSLLVVEDSDLHSMMQLLLLQAPLILYKSTSLPFRCLLHQYFSN